MFPSVGLFGETGAKWHAMRSQVQKDMLRPKSAFFYIDPLQEISKEFVNMLASMRNSQQELPENVLDYLKRWALESVSRILFDARVGALDSGALTEGSFPSTIINQGDAFARNLNRMSIGLPLFKLWPNAFKWYR